MRAHNLRYNILEIFLQLSKMNYPADWLKRAENIRNRDLKQCAGCGRMNVELHVHHIKPLSNGGLNSKDNLITLCRECHQAIHGEQVRSADSAPSDSCYFCTNCNRYYSIEFGRKNNQICPVCESELKTWIGNKRV
jgi:hypothetical protein